MSELGGVASAIDLSALTDGSDVDAIRDMVRSMPLAIALCDPAECPIVWSEAFATLLRRLFDPEAQDRVGRERAGDQELTLADATRRAFDSLLAAPFDDGVCNHESDVPTRLHKVTLSDGAERIIELERSAGMIDNRHTGRSVVVLSDVTGRWQTEHRLRESNEELIQFKYHVSHDLSAPIASARGLLGLISDDLGDDCFDEIPEMVEETGAQLDRLDDLIAGLMSLARVEADAVPHEAVDLRGLIDEIVASISLHPREQEIGVSLTLDEATLRTDRIRLRQILTNLITNARKFRDPDETAPAIDVNVSKERDRHVLTISDNGLGMCASVAEHAFDMFARGTVTHPGHGLGLYIVHKHVERLGGTVRVSHPRKPTVIEVTLPVRKI